MASGSLFSLIHVFTWFYSGYNPKIKTQTRTRQTTRAFKNLS